MDSAGGAEAPKAPPPPNPPLRPGEVFGGNTKPHLPRASTSIVNAYLRDVPVNVSFSPWKIVCEIQTYNS